MSKWAVALAISALLSGCASLPDKRQAGDTRAAEAEIRRLEEGWTTAFNNRDTRFMKDVMAPEYVLFSAGEPQGRNVTNRDAWMRVWLRQDSLPYEAKVLGVVVVGDTAVATLEARWRRESYLTDTWARRQGRWQLIFRHSAARRR
ncbi:nuclear transport factor 2 family protein [Sphingomonas rhizophila]|uniref:Nuclear transport factor 2 family protein n=1 Tax=Sphingomonas rhizophila TaxID=2071607 RepID=A0A7G9SC57_9SPHN|nr:nuclear transport factor 2 family protein [Sphingomonas rhizophila]QNN65432.1 nuclear transport factor 2 family protein [Sphingomonas rhizophila]